MTQQTYQPHPQQPGQHPAPQWPAAAAPVHQAPPHQFPGQQPPAPQWATPPAPPTRRRTGAVVGGVAGVVALAGAGVAAALLLGGSTLDTAAVEQEISRLTEQETGLVPTEVTCPTDIAVEVGASSTCRASLDGQPVSYTVRQTDDEGGVRIDSDETYVLVAVVESSLSEQVGAEAGVEVVVACESGGRSVLVGAIGTPIPCTVAAADDPTDVVDVAATVDDQGAVTYTAP